MNMKNLAQKYFPQLQDWQEMTTHYLNKIESEYGYNVSNLLYGSCICADELNYIATHFNHNFRNSFHLGGLGGMPFTGITGMQAFATHVPDNGAALIFFASHVGIAPDGTIGSLKREHQKNRSYSCGALQSVLELMKVDHEFDWSSKSFKNIQTQTLELMLNGQKERIFSSNEPVIEAVNIIVETSHCLLQNFIIENMNFFTGNHVFLLGGVMINTEHSYENYIEIRHFDVYETK